MKAKTGLGGYGILGIGVASAAVLFVAHRVLDSDGSFPQGPSRPTVDSDPGLERAASPDELMSRADGTRDRISVTADVEAEATVEAEPAGGDPAAASSADPADESLTVDGGASPHIDALSHPSAAYRNASLGRVIREAGYHCTGVLSSSAGHEDRRSWRVSCEEGRAYLVFEARDGVLQVEPLAYFDAPTPFIPREPRDPQNPVVPQPQ